MRTLIPVAVLILVLPLGLRGEDGIVFTSVGVRYVTTNGVFVGKSVTKIAALHGPAFEQVRTNVQQIVSLLGNESEWWDVGPDASYTSAEVQIGARKWVLNSWFPDATDNPRVAVSETCGLVPVPWWQSKSRIEAQNSARYKKLVSIFTLMKKVAEPTFAGDVATRAAPEK